MECPTSKGKEFKLSLVDRGMYKYIQNNAACVPSQPISKTKKPKCKTYKQKWRQVDSGILPCK